MGDHSKEADIVINGLRLSKGESMTVRVALETFDTNLIVYGLGDDEIGVAIAQNYRDCIADILQTIHLAVE